jgi:hypothetical protein
MIKQESFHPPPLKSRGMISYLKSFSMMGQTRKRNQSESQISMEASKDDGVRERRTPTTVIVCDRGALLRRDSESVLEWWRSN